jgi:hypothetical protein
MPFDVSVAAPVPPDVTERPVPVAIAETGMLENVFVDPLIDLFVSVSVVARPRIVSVVVGSVRRAPLFVI